MTVHEGLTYVTALVQLRYLVLFTNKIGNEGAKAILAAIDGRDLDAINAITIAIDKGHRWQYFLSRGVFDRLQDNPRFQAQVNRLNGLVDLERGEILTMLCGPETILTSWEPAPNTCESYQQETTTGNGKI